MRWVCSTWFFDLPLSVSLTAEQQKLIWPTSDSTCTALLDIALPDLKRTGWDMWCDHPDIYLTVVNRPWWWIHFIRPQGKFTKIPAVSSSDWYMCHAYLPILIPQITNILPLLMVHLFFKELYVLYWGHNVPNICIISLIKGYWHSVSIFQCRNPPPALASNEHNLFNLSLSGCLYCCLIKYVSTQPKRKAQQASEDSLWVILF